MIYRAIKFLKRLYLKPKYILNIFNTSYKKTVLICYLPEAFRYKQDSLEFLSHQNKRTCTLIAHSFNQQGFNVDVIQYDLQNIPQKIKNKRYDFVFGLGRSFWNMVTLKTKPTKYIYFATGLPAVIQNKIEEDRVKYFNEKYNTNSKPLRVINFQEDFSKIDAIVALGNQNMIEKLRTVTTVDIYVLNNISTGGEFNSNKIKAPDSKNHFLFFSGKGKILNGLDLILEVFKRRKDIHLHIASNFTGDELFYDVFKDHLENSDNIHTYGFVKIGSQLYFDLIAKCGGLICSVFSAGQTGSVLEGMSQGLIPVVSKECNVDITPDIGFVFKDLTSIEIERSIDQYLSLSDTQRGDMCKKVKKYYNNNHTVDVFKKNISQIIDKITYEKVSIN